MLGELLLKFIRCLLASVQMYTSFDPAFPNFWSFMYFLKKNSKFTPRFQVFNLFFNYVIEATYYLCDFEKQIWLQYVWFTFRCGSWWGSQAAWAPSPALQPSPWTRCSSPTIHICHWSTLAGGCKNKTQFWSWESPLTTGPYISVQEPYPPPLKNDICTLSL